MTLNAQDYSRNAIEFAAAGNHSAAKRAFSEVVRLIPLDSNAWLNLGISCMALQDTSAAINALQRAIALNPSNTAAVANLASIYVAQHQPTIAITHLQEGLAIIPQHPKLTAILGSLLAQAGEMTRALNLLSEAFVNAPDDFSITLIFAELLVQQRQFTQALHVLNAKSCPNHRLLSRYYLALARAYYGCDDAITANTLLLSAKAVGAIEAENLLSHIARHWGGAIESTRISLSPLKPSAATQILQLHRDLTAWRHYNPNGISAISLAALEDEIQTRFNAPTLPPQELAWAVTCKTPTTKFLGLCQLVELNHLDQSAELLMMLDIQHLTDVAQIVMLLLHTSFYQYDLKQIICLVLETNTVVLKMLRRLGFTQTDSLPATPARLYRLTLSKHTFTTSPTIYKLNKRFNLYQPEDTSCINTSHPLHAA